jgi:hypothetical protein
MGNETDKDLHNQQPNQSGTVDQSKKNPSHEGGQSPNQQDPSRKNPAQGGDFQKRQDEGSDQEKRRAS